MVTAAIRVINMGLSAPWKRLRTKSNKRNKKFEKKGTKTEIRVNSRFVYYLVEVFNNEFTLFSFVTW